MRPLRLCLFLLALGLIPGSAPGLVPGSAWAADFSRPQEARLEDPLALLAGDHQLFTGMADSRQREEAPFEPDLIRMPVTGGSAKAVTSRGGLARSGEEGEGDLRFGFVEQRPDRLCPRDRCGERTLMIGSDRDFDLAGPGFTLQSELAYHDGPASGGAGEDSALSALAYAGRLSEADETAAFGYDLQIEYYGDSYQPDERSLTRASLQADWALDEDSSLYGRVSQRLRGLGPGADSLQAVAATGGGTAGLRQSLGDWLLPDLTAELEAGIEQPLGEAEPAALARRRLRLSLEAPLASPLGGQWRSRVTLIGRRAESAEAEIGYRTGRMEFALDQTLELWGQPVSAAFNGGLQFSEGSQIRNDANLGFRFTVGEAERQFELQGQLLAHEDVQDAAQSGLGGSLTGRFAHRSEAYSLGLEAAREEPAASGEAAAYRAGVYMAVAF